MSAPTIDDITAAARRSTQTMVRPSRAFWVEVLRAFAETGNVLAVDDPALTEADLRAALVEVAIRHMPNDDERRAAHARWAKVFGIEVQP